MKKDWSLLDAFHLLFFLWFLLGMSPWSISYLATLSKWQHLNHSRKKDSSVDISLYHGATCSSPPTSLLPGYVRKINPCLTRSLWSGFHFMKIESQGQNNNSGVEEERKKKEKKRWGKQQINRTLSSHTLKLISTHICSNKIVLPNELHSSLSNYYISLILRCVFFFIFLSLKLDVLQ